MQGVLLFLFALIAVNCAQEDDGGCCFYRDINFENEIICTNEPFTIADVSQNKNAEDSIQSFFCTDTYSAAIQSQGGKTEQLLECGDVLDIALKKIPTVTVSVGKCLRRRCCFYTGQQKDGDEYCINVDASPADELERVQKGGKFKVVECMADWSTTIKVNDVKNGPKSLEVACGETFDILNSADLTIIDIKTTPCEVEDSLENSQAIAEAIDDTSDEFAADQAVTDAVADEFAGDQFDAAVGDVQFEEAFDEQYVDQSVDQFAEQLAVDQFAADQAVADASEIFAAEVPTVAQAVYEGEDDFVADGNIDAAFADASYSVDQSVDLAVADFNDAAFADAAVTDAAVADASADQFVDESFSDADQLDDQFDNY
jgi:hypothetical protein